MLDTKSRILDAAENLFAEHGFDATSLRMITSEAGVNLAAVNYHFQTKDELIRAVVARRIEPVNRRRLELLDQVEAEAGDGPLPIRGVVEAFVGPVLEVGRLDQIRVILGRMYSEPSGQLQRVIAKHMGEIANRFRAAFRRALPEIPPEEIMWRVFFTIGVLSHTLAGHTILHVLSNGRRASLDDIEATTRRIVDFAAAGLSAPASTVNTHAESNR